MLRRMQWSLVHRVARWGIRRTHRRRELQRSHGGCFLGHGGSRLRVRRRRRRRIWRWRCRVRVRVRFLLLRLLLRPRWMDSRVLNPRLRPRLDLYPQIGRADGSGHAKGLCLWLGSGNRNGRRMLRLRNLLRRDPFGGGRWDGCSRALLRVFGSLSMCAEI